MRGNLHVHLLHGGGGWGKGRNFFNIILGRIHMNTSSGITLILEAGNSTERRIQDDENKAKWEKNKR